MLSPPPPLPLCLLSFLILPSAYSSPNPPNFNYPHPPLPPALPPPLPPTLLDRHCWNVCPFEICLIELVWGFYIMTVNYLGLLVNWIVNPSAKMRIGTCLGVVWQSEINRIVCSNPHPQEERYRPLVFIRPTHVQLASMTEQWLDSNLPCMTSWLWFLIFNLIFYLCPKTNIMIWTLEFRTSFCCM